MSQFVVSARKYRPQTFDEVVGQNHIARTLKNALATDHLAHAFLFCGPRGVGKTTCARILAKVLNCENLQDAATPCNECSSCVSFNNNASFNIIELDAASNNSVNDMRNLIEQVRFQPQQGKYKIFIIDEVHMLSTQAFNAFLKTLEEPPEYGIFILATTEKHKIIPTILSRCQIFDFKRIQVDDIVSNLQEISNKEGRKADYEALHIIAEKADGAMRDALSIYDKIASASGEHITYKEVIENLNILDYDYFFRLVDGFLKQDLSSVYLILDDTVRKGFDVEQTLQGLAEHLRDLLVCKAPETLTLLNTTAELKARYQAQAELCQRGFLMSALNILNQVDIHFPRAKNKRLHVEIAFGKINYLSSIVRTGLIEEKKTKVVSESPGLPDPAPILKANPQPTATPQAPEKQEDKPQPPTTHSPASTPQQATQDSPTSTRRTIERDSGRASKVMDTPRISSTMDLLKQVQQIEADKKELKKNLHKDTITKMWNDYASTIPSPSVRTALNQAMVDFARETISVIVPSVFSKDIIMQEKDLLAKIRAATGTPELKLDITVDKANFPDYEDKKPKKLLSNKEKYDHMREKNPLIDSLRDTFNLQVDK